MVQTTTSLIKRRPYQLSMELNEPAVSLDNTTRSPFFTLSTRAGGVTNLPTEVDKKFLPEMNEPCGNYKNACRWNVYVIRDSVDGKPAIGDVILASEDPDHSWEEIIDR